MYQQGDVILIPVSKTPDNANAVTRHERGYVLAEGEVTGHAHVIEDDIKMVEQDGVLYIGCESDVIIKHEEHNHITIPAGCYEVRKVKEYDHFAEEVREVAD